MINNNLEQVTWQWQTFHQLSNVSLYRLMQLRAEVFVVEQQCAYQDLDDKDLSALHLLGWNEQQQELIAAARVLFPEKIPQPLSFGRVVVAQKYRRMGIGEKLISEIMNYLNVHHSGKSIVISAQFYLIDFYRKFGFEIQGEPYDEDGIKHIKMLNVNSHIKLASM